MLNKKNFLIPILTFCSFIIVKAQTNDTIFIKYDKKYLIKREHPFEKYIYYFFYEDIYSEDSFYFIEQKHYTETFSYKENYISLKRLLKSKGLKKNLKTKRVYDDWKLFEYFDKKTIYLIKKDTIIELEPHYLIE